MPEGIKLDCDCAGRCSVLCVDFDKYDESEHTWSWDFYTNSGYDHSWYHRVRIAWNVLRGKDHYFHGTVHTVKDMERLRSFLNQTLPSKPWTPSPPIVTGGAQVTYE